MLRRVDTLVFHRRECSQQCCSVDSDAEYQEEVRNLELCPDRCNAISATADVAQPVATDLSSSFALLVWFFFRFGTGILHSMENATQFVHGTPKEAASQRTYITSVLTKCLTRETDVNIPYESGMSNAFNESVWLMNRGEIGSVLAAEVLGLSR